MNATWLVTNLIAAFLLPPVNLLLVGLAGVWLLKRRRTLGKALIVASLGGIWLLATPVVADRLLAGVSLSPFVPRGDEAQAIVVLGGGLQYDEVEYGGDSPGRFTLPRLRYAAWLARRTGHPVLVSGGTVDDHPPEARVMRTVLEGEYGVPVRWVEDRSTNTWENARFSAEMLRAAGVSRIYLVSQAWHLKRAVPEFERAGLGVVPVGTAYPLSGETRLMDFVPNAKALQDSYVATHEAIGLVWYRIRNLF